MIGIYQEKRQYPRYNGKEKVQISIKNDDIQRHLLDISCGGARITGSPTGKLGTTGKIELLIDDIKIERMFYICEEKNEKRNSFGVRFNDLVPSAELAKYARTLETTSNIQLALSDYTEVNSEIKQIQSCRGSIFQGVLAIISTWIMGASALALTNNLNASLGLLVGSLFPFIILSIAIFATIEKTRSINRRKGFLIAMNEYIRHNVAPPNYLGWPTLQANRSECRARMKSELCRGRTECCWSNEINNNLPGITGRKHIIPKVLDSFTAFSSVVYAVLYAITALIFLISTLFCLNGHVLGQCISAVLEGAFTLALGVVLFILLKGIRRGKQSAEANYLMWKCVLENCLNIKGDVKK